jgi:hypothetical protein
MKKLLFIMLAGSLLLAACIPPEPVTPAGPNVETMVAMTLESLTASAPTISNPTPTIAIQNGIVIAYKNVSFILPTGLATNALTGTIPAAIDEDPGWGLAPEHIKIELDGYSLGDTFHEPQFFIFPAQEYAALNEGAGASIARLQALLNGSAALSAENLPHVASFNAGQLFAAQIQLVSFTNGSGVRFLTEYGQYYATANNRDLFYQFQGLTSDGKYYILAILPISHPSLAFDEKPETTIPAGGIPFPGWDNQDAIPVYYTNVVNLLNTAAPDSFRPDLGTLDAMIQSITITP